MNPLHSYLKASPFLHCYYVEPESPTMYIGGIVLCDIYPSREHKDFGKVKGICYLASCSATWHGWPGTRAALWYLFIVRLKIHSPHRYHMHRVSGYTHSVTPHLSLLCTKKDLVQNAGSGFYWGFRVSAEFCNSYQVLKSPRKCLSLFLNLATIALSRKDAQLLACLKSLEQG